MNQAREIAKFASVNSQRSWLLPLAIGLGLLGLTLSYSVFEVVRRNHEARLQNEFHLEVNRQIAKLEQGLSRAAERLSSVGAFYLGSGEVDAQEFRNFTAGYLHHRAGLSMLAWATIEISDQHLENNDASVMRGMSLPLVHIEPGPQEHLKFGDDLLTIPGMPAAVEVAFERGNVEYVLTDNSIILVQPTLDAADWSGVAIAVLPIDSLRSWISIDDWGIAVSVIEERTGQIILQSDWVGDEARAYDAAVSFGTDIWRVTAMPKPGRSMTRNAWATLAAGVIITALLLMLVLALESNALRAEKIVQVRTRELEQAETEARRQAIRLADEVTHASQVISSIPSILISLDKNARITQWNQATTELSGIESKTAIGRPLQECGWHGDIDALVAAVSRSHSDNAKTQLDNLTFTHPDGTDATIGMTVIPMRDSEQSLDGYLILGADVTEKNKMAMQLNEALRLEAVGRLAAGIAHEVNTPAQFVSDNTSFLKEAFNDLIQLDAAYEGVFAEMTALLTDEQKQRIAECQDAADRDFLLEEVPQALEQSMDGIKRIADIVRAMKEFSHPGGGAGKEQVDFNHLITNAITVARNEWKYHAEVETHFDENLPPLPCYPRELNQVVLNLLINAAHAIADRNRDTGTLGKVTIKTCHDDEVLQMQLTDTGCGIPEQVRGKIFEPFFTTKEVGRGSGQGLALAYSAVVEQHGGQLTFETELGVGTTFFVKLPLRLQEVESEATA